MTSQLKWRLSKLPTVDELLKLVNDKVITQEEAKEILFNKETENERDIESYKQEIKFLKEVIEKLGDRSTIVQVVKEYVPHYINQPFYQPYWYWTAPSNTYCVTTGTTSCAAGSNALTNYSSLASASGGNTCYATAQDCSFSSIVS